MISWLKNWIRPAQVVTPSQALPPVQPEMSSTPAAQDPAQVSTFAVGTPKEYLLQLPTTINEPVGSLDEPDTTILGTSQLAEEMFEELRTDDPLRPYVEKIKRDLSTGFEHYFDSNDRDSFAGIYWGFFGEKHIVLNRNLWPPALHEAVKDPVARSVLKQILYKEASSWKTHEETKARQNAIMDIIEERYSHLRYLLHSPGRGWREEAIKPRYVNPARMAVSMFIHHNEYLGYLDAMNYLRTYTDLTQNDLEEAAKKYEAEANKPSIASFLETKAYLRAHAGRSGADLVATFYKHLDEKRSPLVLVTQSAASMMKLYSTTTPADQNEFERKIKLMFAENHLNKLYDLSIRDFILAFSWQIIALSEEKNGIREAAELNYSIEQTPEGNIPNETLAFLFDPSYYDLDHIEKALAI